MSLKSSMIGNGKLRNEGDVKLPKLIRDGDSNTSVEAKFPSSSIGNDERAVASCTGSIYSSLEASLSARRVSNPSSLRSISATFLLGDEIRKTRPIGSTETHVLRPLGSLDLALAFKKTHSLPSKAHLSQMLEVAEFLWHFPLALLHDSQERRSFPAVTFSEIEVNLRSMVSRWR